MCLSKSWSCSRQRPRIHCLAILPCTVHVRSVSRPGPWAMLQCFLSWSTRKAFKRPPHTMACTMVLSKLHAPLVTEVKTIYTLRTISQLQKLCLYFQSRGPLGSEEEYPSALSQTGLGFTDRRIRNGTRIAISRCLFIRSRWKVLEDDTWHFLAGRLRHINRSEQFRDLKKKQITRM